MTYTDEQFFADLAKSKDALDEMVRQAREAYERGETEEFPRCRCRTTPVPTWETALMEGAEDAEAV